MIRRCWFLKSMNGIPIFQYPDIYETEDSERQFNKHAFPSVTIVPRKVGYFCNNHGSIIESCERVRRQQKKRLVKAT